MQNDDITLESWSIHKLLQNILTGDVKAANDQFSNIHFEVGLSYDAIFTGIIDEVDKMPLEKSIIQKMIDTTGTYAYRLSDSDVNKNLQTRCYLNSLAMIAGKSKV